MLFSLHWLMELCPVGDGPERVAELLTRRGLTVDALEASGQDFVLDVDIPANRPDCLGHLGLARELSAASATELAKSETIPALEAGAAWVDVEIADAELCPRYTAGLVRGVRIGPSPEWVVRRLETCGLRSISNVVDASNLVLLALGHPIHFFDYARLETRAHGQAPRIIVRRAQDGERLETLDEIERQLDEQALVIADGAGAVALAGVIGGTATQIHPETTDVLVEAAQFDPRSIRATARRLGVQTDASFRFERGVDPATANAAQALAARLLLELAGGEAASGIVDAWPGRRPLRRLELRMSELERLLGYRPDEPGTRGALAALALEPTELGPGRLEIVVPSWRIDLEREADLVEEVARHLGYDQIPSALPEAGFAEATRPPSERARDVIGSLGFHEAFGYSMIAAGEDDAFVRAGTEAPLELTNPIAEPMARLRRSVLPGLLRAVELNQRRGIRDVRLFECGRVFLPRDGEALPREPAHVAVAWSGSAEPRHWSRAEREPDLFDLMGVAERVLQSLGVEVEPERVAIGRAAFHPGLSFCWRAGDRDLAWGGALHPSLAERFEVPVFAAELDLDAAAGLPHSRPRYSVVSRLPAVTRDLAVVLTPGTPFADVLDALHRVEAPAPVEFEAVDRYEGPPLEPGQVSLTVRLSLRPLERMLIDAEIEGFRARLIEALDRQLGVGIRS